MSKCVLVMDMPKNCLECLLGKNMSIPIEICIECPMGKCAIDAETETRPSWCPLKPMPQKQELTFHEPGQDAITMGWNACIEQIEGE